MGEYKIGLPLKVLPIQIKSAYMPEPASYWHLPIPADGAIQLYYTLTRPHTAVMVSFRADTKDVFNRKAAVEEMFQIHSLK